MLEDNRKFMFAKLLLSMECVQFNLEKPFNYASGLKGPLYTDNRKITSFVEERLTFAEGFINIIQENNLKFDIIAGLATGGIPLGMLVAHLLSKPFIYVRSKPKAHGKKGQVEGQFGAGQSVLMVEDLVNQGSSLESAIKGTIDAGLKVTDCVCILDYQTEGAKSILEKYSVSLHSLTNFNALHFSLASDHDLPKESLDSLSRWHSDPKNWP